MKWILFLALSGMLALSCTTATKYEASEPQSMRLQCADDCDLNNVANLLKQRLDAMELLPDQYHVEVRSGVLELTLLASIPPELTAGILSSGRLNYWRCERVVDIGPKLQVLADSLPPDSGEVDLFGDATTSIVYQLIQPNIVQTGAGYVWGQGSIFGYCKESNQLAADSLLKSDLAREVFGPEVHFAIEAQPFEAVDGTSYSSIYALSKKEMSAVACKDIRLSSDPDAAPGSMLINLIFDGKDASDWKYITERNIGREIAMELDGRVFAAPTVNEAIKSGRTELQGDFQYEEAVALRAAILFPYPSPLIVVE